MSVGTVIFQIHDQILFLRTTKKHTVYVAIFVISELPKYSTKIPFYSKNHVFSKTIYKILLRRSLLIIVFYSRTKYSRQ